MGNSNRGGTGRAPAAAQDRGDAVDHARLPEAQERADRRVTRDEDDARAALGRLLRDQGAALESEEHVLVQ